MILATTKVEDFDRFLKIFSTKGAEKRKQHGSKGATVFRDPNEDDRVWVLSTGMGRAGRTLSPTRRSRPSFKKPGTKVGPRRPSSAVSTTPRTARPDASSANEPNRAVVRIHLAAAPTRTGTQRARCALRVKSLRRP
jgi:hypothetical protein